MSTNNHTPESRREAALKKLLADPSLKKEDKEFFRSAIMMQEYVEHICNIIEDNPPPKRFN